MLIKKSIFLAFFITCFFSLQSSQVTAVKDYMQAKKELKEACEQVNVDQVQALASYFHTQQLSTQEEKAAYKTILNAHTKTWSKKKKRGYLQLGLSATSFLLGYLCWNSEGYNTLQDYSSNMNPMLKETQNKLLHAYKQNNIGDIKDEAYCYAGLYLDKSYQKTTFYAQKSMYGLGCLGLFGSGCSLGYAGLKNILADDNRNNTDLKKKCSAIIDNLPCHEPNRA